MTHMYSRFLLGPLGGSAGRVLQLISPFTGMFRDDVLDF